MAHKHSVYDTDTHFSINPITRALKNEASGKVSVIQFDHNSERFTFEIPRKVEDHDMSLCNVIQIHYINIDSQTKAKNVGVYEVDDMQISPESDDVVILSWLISQNATQLVGSLNFLIRFACVTDGTVDYVWNTAIYSGISVSSGIYNGEAVVEEYADILEQWRQDLIEAGGVTDEQIADAVEAYMAENPVECNIKPVAKTADMTQPVGIDENGQLWVAPIGGGSSGGTDEPDTPVVTTHGIVWDLVNVSTSNAVNTVNDGASLSAVLTASDGYTLGDVIVTMGGEALTGVWNVDTATVTIVSVTGDVVISCAGVVATTETEITHTWSNGVWNYDTESETWALNTGVATRAVVVEPIDASDGYLRIRFNRQDSYDQYMSDVETDCPMIEVLSKSAAKIKILPTSRISNLGNSALFHEGNTSWVKLEWDTDYYVPAGYIYRIQVGRNIYPLVLDEDSLTTSAYGSTLNLGSSNANLKTIVTTPGFCTITKIAGSTGVNETTVAQAVDAQYTQDLAISMTSLVPEDTEDEPTTYTGVQKKAITEWMTAYKGDTRKIPVIIHTDQHGRLTSGTKGGFTVLGNAVPWYDMSKIMNLGDTVSDHWIDADPENPFLSCKGLENMMECLSAIPVSKRMDVFGNHDTWYQDADGNDVVVTDQARLSQYFRHIFARNPNSNQQGYFVDYDNKYNVKYVVVSGFEYTTSRSTYRIGTSQMKWLIDEMGKDDGYDIVVVSHVPLYYQPSTEMYPTGMTPSDAGSESISRVSNVDTDTLFNARKNKTSGSVTDSDGVEHTFDFSGCTTDILCGLHGHIHMDAYNYVGGSGLLNATFDWFDDNTLHFVLVDRENRQLNVWKVDNTPQVENYQIPFDKPAE